MTKDDEGFVLVKSKGRKRRGIRPPEIRAQGGDKEVEALTSRINDVVVLADVDAIFSKIRTNVAHLESSGFVSHVESLLVEALRTLECQESTLDVVCFGLGSFSKCPIARYQFALLVGLMERRVVSLSQPELFDPVFTVQDIEVIQRCGMRVLEENEEGKRETKGPTLFYMPHCSHHLVNNLLFANWTPDLMSNCIVVSNSFNNMFHTMPPRLLKQILPFIDKVKDFHEEFEIKNSFQYTDIFNDTSIHVFPNPKIRNCSLDEHFWMDKQLPLYKDAEIITASQTVLS